MVDDRLKSIVSHVQASALSNDVKADIYVTIQEGLRTVAMPILVKHLPEAELTDLAANPQKISIDTYIDLIGKTVKDGAVFKEIELALTDVLTKVEEQLEKNGV